MQEYSQSDERRHAGPIVGMINSESILGLRDKVSQELEKSSVTTMCCKVYLHVVSKSCRVLVLIVNGATTKDTAKGPGST